MKENDKSNKFGGLERVLREDGEDVVWTLPEKKEVEVDEDVVLEKEEDLPNFKVRSLPKAKDDEPIKGWLYKRAPKADRPLCKQILLILL